MVIVIGESLKQGQPVVRLLVDTKKIVMIQIQTLVILIVILTVHRAGQTTVAAVAYIMSVI
jgi:hypothetical protein